MRRRRKSTGAWLPIIPSAYGSETASLTFYESSLTLPTPVSAGDTSIAVTPLTYDDSSNQIDSGDASSLRDKVEGQDYLLKRIVGKVWMDIASEDESELVDGIGCIAACVLPTDDAGAPSIPAEEYHPLYTQNSQQPWIWRRTWRLARQVDGVNGIYPPSTGYYHGSMDSGHIDTKGTFRRITKEHRVFLVAAFGALTTAGDASSGLIQWGADVRLYGQMRRAKNVSSF